MQGKIQNIIEKGLACIKIRHLHRITPVVNWNGACINGKDVVIESTRWASLLNHMESPSVLCCFILTLGEEIDRLIEASQQTSLFETFVLDAFGSVMTEYAANQLTRHLKHADDNKVYEYSRRFSPGYCDWKLKSGQDALFHFLKPEAIDLQCLPTGAMVPEKSISAVMIGAKKIKHASPCFFCNEGSCAHKRVK
ncbi:MAG: hypothetical protein JRI91_01120 [Deltaproteobacteria bacterium]|nr:hypothetical protein [Deltaproteobacteria bacterium]